MCFLKLEEAHLPCNHEECKLKQSHVQCNIQMSNENPSIVQPINLKRQRPSDMAPNQGKVIFEQVLKKLQQDAAGASKNVHGKCLEF